MKDEYKNILVEIVRKHLPQSQIYLFGSRARKTNQPESDIDIAIDNGAPISQINLSNIREDIEESTIPFTVDVLDLQTVSLEMKKEILREKVKWKI